MSQTTKTCIALLLTMVFYGCGHTKISKVGLLSVGDLESRTIPSTMDGPILVGKDSGNKIGKLSYFLSEAVRNALSGTEYDTIVDAEVTTKTGLFGWSNKIEVKGKGIDSSVLTREGGSK